MASTQCVCTTLRPKIKLFLFLMPCRQPRILTSRSPHSHFHCGVRADPAFSLPSWCPRSGPTQHSHLHRVGRGVADPRILILFVVGTEWPIPHSHFYRGGRGVGDPRILTSIVVSAEWPIPHSHLFRGGRGHGGWDRTTFGYGTTSWATRATPRPCLKSACLRGGSI